MLNPQRVASRNQMLELHGQTFLFAFTELRSMIVYIDGIAAQDAVAGDADRLILTEHLARLIPSIQDVGSRSALAAANRLSQNLSPGGLAMDYAAIRAKLLDVESRFADHLDDIKLFVIRDDQAILFGGADALIGEATAHAFPSIWFDCEEAAKCLCLGRSTACVFPTMRMLETGIGALAKRLGISDPVKTTDRNWGAMLNAIKSKIDELYPSKNRLAGTQGTFFEKIYASLDAIKNPWRNGTMHVENVYTDEEARYILSCSVTLLQIMAHDFDENGQPTTEPLLALHE